MTDILVGQIASSTSIVTEELTVDFLGPGVRVLGTPFLVLKLEFAARDLVKPFLDDRFDTVGTLIDVRHLAATPIGMNVVFRAEVVSVEERTVRFKVEAFDDKEKIAEGVHERFIVNIERFAAKLSAKLADC